MNTNPVTSENAPSLAHAARIPRVPNRFEVSSAHTLCHKPAMPMSKCYPAFVGAGLSVITGKD